MNHQNSNSSSRRRGFALVIVLAFLALIVVMTVSFLSRATTERSAAAGGLSATSARQLADTAVNLVQGQINQATGQGPTIAWSSQPGMVRTSDTNGKLRNTYKLYSADLMVSGTTDFDHDLPTADWYLKPAIWTDLNAPVTDGTGAKNYPILNEAAEAQGFKLTGAPTAATADPNPVPMPVRWLYMLKDGTLVAPGESGTTATITGEMYSGSPNDPNGNPIVGRVAFWTDDETCKVNINTASEGTYWDVPRMNTNQDWAFGNHQPAQREFQSYPGHPATVSLSAVFPNLSSDQIFQIAPRVVGGGSRGGSQIATTPLTPDKHRLYADIDELIFDPERKAENGLDKANLEKSKFFITAHSRAPEVNLFNLPRIASWPIFEGLATNRVTAFDKLIAFCSTVNGNNYYFQRNQAASPTNDIEMIDRNQDLYAYLQYLTERDIPGFGGTFLSKYSDDRDQILTEIFDYVRSSNLYDDNLIPPNQFTNGRNTDSVKTPQIGHGWVAPTVYNETVGFGRSVTLSEMGIGFICNAMADDPTTTGTDESAGSNSITSGTGTVINTVLGGTPLEPGTRYIQAILIPEFFSAMQGFTIFRPSFAVKITGLSSLKVSAGGEPRDLFPHITLEDGAEIPMDEATAAYSAPLFDNPRTGRALGGTLDWRSAFLSSKSPKNTWDTTYGGKGAPTRGKLAADDENIADLYPFIGIPVIIKTPVKDGKMRFSGSLKVKIYAGASLPAQEKNLVQTISIVFPEAEVPAPTIVTGPFPPTTTGTSYDNTTKEQWWSFQKAGCIAGKKGRLSFVGDVQGQPSAGFQAPGQFLRWDFDTIRTVLPKHGDYRLIAGRKEVPNTVFVPRPGYYSNTARYLTNLCGFSSWGFVFTDRTARYFSAINPSDEYKPDIPTEATLQERPEATGDLDTGISDYVDGPFINKPDEGNNWRGTDGTKIPYKDSNWVQTPGGTTQFSPNRQIPSPGMFGSLPTGVKAGTPWQTLLFRPQPSHPQSIQSRPAQPPDHLFLDLFWMPVVEPYAISDRFSTAGKINLNYQIVPFTYIERSTGMRALFKSEKLAAIPTNTPWNTYKRYTDKPHDDIFRLNIDSVETLKQFEDKFAAKDVYKSASEICDIWIVPDGKALKYTDMENFWKTQKLTGDNLRERIYTTLYPRLTTKSNTFTVHFRAQALKKNPKSAAGVWTEGKDIVTGEYRGSTSIERFIDPNNPNIPDYAKNPAAISTSETLDKFYKWRVISNRQFAP